MEIVNFVTLHKVGMTDRFVTKSFSKTLAEKNILDELHGWRIVF